MMGVPAKPFLKPPTAQRQPISVQHPHLPLFSAGKGPREGRSTTQMNQRAQLGAMMVDEAAIATTRLLFSLHRVKKKKSPHSKATEHC